MKTLKFFPAIILGVFLLTSSNAFAQPNKKVSPALAAFTNTDFMMKFHDLRIEAESAALGVIQNQDKFAQRDYKKLRTSYDQTTQRANNMLNGIKVDFLDKKKLKMIANYPEMYTEGLRFKLNDLSEFYANNFQQTLADAQVMEEDGSAILLLITELIGLTKGLVDYVAEIKKEARRYNDAYLNQHLVGPYRWKTWGELDGTKTYQSPTNAADLQPQNNRKNEFDAIENRMGRVTERYEAVKSNNKAKANNDTSTTDDWGDEVQENTDDTWDDWGDDTGTDTETEDTGDWDDWGDDTDTGTDSDSDSDDWGDWEDGGGNPNGNNFKYEEWNEGDDKDKKKKKKKAPKKDDN